jgi:predicted metalloprotease
MTHRRPIALLAAALITALAMSGVLARRAAASPTRAASGAAAATPEYETTVELAVHDLQRWWAEQLPTVYGIDYVPIPSTKVIAYTSKTKIPQCGTAHATYSDVAMNAFYCSTGKYVAYDDEQLFPYLAHEFGDFTIALTLAHEWGHAIQDQAGITGPTIAKEQQADCFAGAWVRHLADGESPALSLKAGNLDTGLAGYLTLRDSPGSDPAAADAHGSAFDRVGAFQEGYDKGAARCATFDTDPPPLTDIAFSSGAEAKSGGNAPLRDVVPGVVADLDKYWGSLLSDYETVAIKSFDAKAGRPKCGASRLPKTTDIAFCPRTNTIVVDRTLFSDVYRRSGDFGVASVVAAEWAVAMQHHEDVTGDDKALELQQSCFTGSWTGSIINQGHGTTLVLSPGDLDEVIESYLIFTDQGKVEAGTGATAFENVDAFRLGFLSGENACVALAPAS